MYPDDPIPIHDIPFAPSTAASVRHSVWSAEPQNDIFSATTNAFSTTTSRRNSIAPIFARKAAEEASGSANSEWRYSASFSQNDLTDVTRKRQTSTPPVLKQKAATNGANPEKEASVRRGSGSPGPVLKSKSGLVYGNSAWHSAEAPVLSPTEESKRSSGSSFKTAREQIVETKQTNGQTARRFSDGAGLTSKNGFVTNGSHPAMPGAEATEKRKSRRHSDLTAVTNGNFSPRNVSPVDSRGSGALGQVNMSGAVSHINRNSSPIARGRKGTAGSSTNGFVSPLARNGAATPTSGFVSPMARNGAMTPTNGFGGPVPRAGGVPRNPSVRASMPGALPTSPLARDGTGASPSPNKQREKLSLNTQVGPQGEKKSPTPSEAEEEMDEVIALSPAQRAPLQNFRRSRNSLMLSADTPAQSLDTLVEGESSKPYFGQDVNMDDLVAVNLENAFDRL